MLCKWLLTYSFRPFKVTYGGLALIGKTPVLKTGGLAALGVRVPHPPQWRVGRAVMQRIANPSTFNLVARVQISHSPQKKHQTPS